MTDRPILFSAPMVRALLEGRKSQTRRVLKPQPHDNDFCGPGMFHPTRVDRHGEEHPGPAQFGIWAPDGFWTQRLPYAPGDRLWVKETWRTNAMWDACSPSRLGQILQESGRVSVLFEAGGSLPNSVSAEDAGRTRSPIHMPRWASRLTLLVTHVRVERLQDISIADCIAEGIPPGGRENPDDIARREYRDLWNSLHGPDAWDQNPWVVAVSFEVRKGNVDG